MKQDCPVSVLLLTLNEEGNLPSCLEAIDWCDDIVVVDSYSCDQTVQIAEKAGARVYQRQFSNFADQRNFALEKIKFKHEWVFHLDADEIITLDLRMEIQKRIGNTDYHAYRVPSKTIFQGKWLKYAGMYPVYQVRLTKIPGFTFKQVGHGQKEDIDPEKIGTFKNPYLHYSFSKGINEWFEKHNRYSTHEAKEAAKQLKSGRIDWIGLFSTDAYTRRMALKDLSIRLPFRPSMRFLYMFIIRRGILDGMAGYTYCRLLAVYEYMICLKVDEIRKE